jgi:acetylornithine deacetylase/succinyl-diaminopimelate desuccinylase-like protein
MPVPKDNYFKFGQRLTVATIKGGRAINITPDDCVAQIDVRTSPEFKKSRVTKLIQSTIDRITRIDNEAEFKLTYDLGQEGYSFSEKNKLIKSLSNAIKVNHGKSVETIANGPAHIGNLLAEYGIPVTVWGPRGGKVHSYDEFIELDSLTKTSKVYFDMTRDYFMLSE